MRKVYPDGTEAIPGFDLEVNDGEFMVFVGPSGCGKSTALRMTAGLEEITGGRLLIGGDVVNGKSPQERDIAMVFQDYALYPHMTVAENMGFALRMMKMPKEEIRRRVETAAERLSLTALLDRVPKNLSGGQRQRVAMGRAIVREPQVFLMDEPLSNLDAKLRVQMRAEIAAIQHQLGVTTLYVTHDQVEAMTMGDRVAVMKNGRLMQCASPQELYDRPANVFVAGFIGSPKMNLFKSVIDRDADGRARIRFGEQLVEIDAEVVAANERLRGYPSGPLVVGMRPEALSVASSDDDPHSLVIICRRRRDAGLRDPRALRGPGGDGVRRRRARPRPGRRRGGVDPGQGRLDRDVRPARPGGPRPERSRAAAARRRVGPLLLRRGGPGDPLSGEPGPTAMAATIRDVAAAAGVSTATVSRALHAGAGVSPRTRLRVEEAARRLAYRPSATAARLASGRHGAVAFVVRGPLLSSGVEVLDGVCSTLAGAGLDCSLHLLPQEAELDEALLADLAGRVDAAVVLTDAQLTLPPALPPALPLTVVAAGGDVPGLPGAFVDLAAAASLAAGHLATARYRQVAVLSDGRAGGDAVFRLVESAAWAGGGRVRAVRNVVVDGSGTDDAARAASAVLADPSPPDALLCTSDRLVRGAARALQLQGLMAGDDVGLLGIGGEQTGIDLEVSMVVEPRQQLGAAAAAIAAGLTGGAPATGERVLLAPQLMVRWSTARRRRNLA